MLVIKPFGYTDEDYAIITAIDAAVFDDHPVPVEEWKHGDQVRNPDYPFQRDLIWRDGQVVGFGEYGQNQWAYHPQKYFCLIYAHPQLDAADLRPAYVQHVLRALRDKNLIALTSGMLENKPEAMRFFAEHGFGEVAREQISMLDVTAFDARQFASVLERVRAAGIEIVTLRELQGRDSDWQCKLFDLDTTISRDIPSTGDKHPATFESWLNFRANGPTFDPDGWFVALDGGQYIGESQGSVNDAEPDQFQTGVTGVRRDYHRRGIATALKVHAISYAQRRGVKQIVTNNDSKNPMYQLNLMLGFQPQPAWVRVEKSLVSA